MPGDTRADSAVIKPLGGAYSVGTLRACLVSWMLWRQVDLMAHATEQPAHAPGPGLAIDVHQRRQFGQVMRIAQRMRDTGRPEIGCPMIVHNDTDLEAFGP